MDPKFILPASIYASKGSNKSIKTNSDKPSGRKKRDQQHDMIVLAPKPKRGAQGPKKPPMFGKRSPGFSPRQYWILTNLYDNSTTCGQMPKDHFLRLFHLVFAHRLLAIKTTDSQELIQANEILASFESADRRGFYFMSVDFNNPHHGSMQNIRRVRELFENDNKEVVVTKIVDPHLRKTIFKNVHKIHPEENGSHGEVTGWDDVEMSGRYPICGSLSCLTCFHECYVCEDETERCTLCQRYSFLKQHKGGQCTASRNGLCTRLPTCGVDSCLGCKLRCTKCALFQCGVCLHLSLKQRGSCTAGEGWGTDTEPSWETIASSVVTGWTILPEQIILENHPFVTSSLNGSHGEATNSDDVARIDNALAQMQGALAFRNEDAGNRNRREARNHQHRRPRANRNANVVLDDVMNPILLGNPDVVVERVVNNPDLPNQAQPPIVPVVPLPLVANAFADEPDVLPPRVATRARVDIPSMDPSIEPLRLYNRCIIACVTGVPTFFMVAVFSPRDLAPIYFTCINLCFCLGITLFIMRLLNFDVVRRVKRMFYGLRPVFNRPKFRMNARGIRTMQETTGPDRTYLAMSDYTGYFVGDIYDEVSDQAVLKYTTGPMTESKQNIVYNYMSELLKSDYPGTQVDVHILINTLIFTTGVILELQNTTKCHTVLPRAAYASSSMM